MFLRLFPLSFVFSMRIEVSAWGFFIGRYTSLTIKALLNDAECQTFKGLVAMKEDSYTFDLEG